MASAAAATTTCAQIGPGVHPSSLWMLAGRASTPATHPIISEILFAVPTGLTGDANLDGTRHVCGDEFVELVNPNAESMSLTNYTLMDLAAWKAEHSSGGSRTAGAGAGLKFVFPHCTLAPRSVALVFNGCGQVWSGPVGDQARAPAAGNELFAGALTFTMKARSQRQALGNAGDAVILIDPSGQPIECIFWGDADRTVIESIGALLSTEVSVPRPGEGSVERTDEGSAAPMPKPGFTPGVSKIQL